jgi:hypothetical protein
MRVLSTIARNHSIDVSAAAEVFKMQVDIREGRRAAALTVAEYDA